MNDCYEIFALSIEHWVLKHLICVLYSYESQQFSNINYADSAIQSHLNETNRKWLLLFIYGSHSPNAIESEKINAGVYSIMVPM